MNWRNDVGYFIFQWIVLVLGLSGHLWLDRSPRRRTATRTFELGAVWILAWSGVFNILGGIYHIGPSSDSTARTIGYAQSMFQWEVGWADLAFGVLCVGCVLKRNRGSWLTAAVIGLSIYFYGDGIGHIMQIVSHNNHATDNVWSMPSDFLVPLAATVFTVLYRRRAGLAANLETSQDMGTADATRR
jgi:hypothetical protein